MKIIVSSNGYQLQVDDELYEELNKENWWVSKKGYALCNKWVDNKRTTVEMQCLVLDIVGIAHPERVDHIDMNLSNYQKDNLRPATDSESAMHRGIYKNNTSGFKGVSFDSKSNKWRAYINYQKERIYLGRFTDEKEAARAYDKAAKIYHKDFAILNFPED